MTKYANSVNFEEGRKLVPKFKAAKSNLNTGKNSYVVESTILNVLRDHQSELRMLDISGCTNATAHVLDSLVARSLVTSLRHLDIGGCDIQGDFPDALYEQLFQMDFFRFMGNNFANVGEQTLKAALIYEFNTIKDQKSIVLSGRLLEGVIPDFSKCTTLEKLDLSSNNLSGEIGDFSACVNLKRLELSNNKLTGSIPDFSKCIALKALGLGANELTGNVPKSLKSLSQLSLLALYENQLEIPPQAPLYSGGHMFYNNREAVASFLEVL